MIQLNKNYSLPDALADTVPVKVVSVGGAGLNALDRIVLDGLEKASVVAINTDVQSLTSSVAAHKVQLGRTRTRGLGTGGDPELGYEAAVESADEIREALTDTRMVFVCAGLGGGTGSGAAPYVAHLAREAGALVIAFVTLPFTFEGKRRATQAREALGRLNEIAHSVICFENDRMGDLVAPQAGIHHAFAMADTTISQSVRSVVNLIQRPGLIRIGFDDLLAALRVRHGRCLFGFGESDSDNRAHDALTQALKNPLMDRGRMLADATNVLVQVSGGAGMTLSEVEVLMQELGRHVNEQTQILFGAVVDGKLGDRLAVTIISSLAADEDLISESRDGATLSNVFAQPPVREQHPPPQIHIEPEAAMEPVAHEESISFEQPVAAQATPAAESMPGESEPLPVAPHKKAVPHTDEKAAAKSVPAKQEILQFEPVTRGRFEKSEPTIVEGEDLDVPTYLRKNIKVK
ncbi:MAG: cell division protein FtsZ [Verrucomicrobia bacterium]|nr:MAG: cell division protein FtsZ [Verrucomicrobiota bacterium]